MEERKPPNGAPHLSFMPSTSSSYPKNASATYLSTGEMTQKSLQSKISSELLKIVRKLHVEEGEQERNPTTPCGPVLFGEDAGRVLAVSSEFQPYNTMYQAENLMKYNKHSAWVAKTAGNEFVEVSLSHGKEENCVCHVECIQLYNLNTIKYKLSFQRACAKSNHTMSGCKIYGRKGLASTLKTEWEAFSATPNLVKCPGDVTEWIVELNDEEKMIDISSIRLDVVGNVNMATFYALRVWGTNFSNAIPRAPSNTEAFVSASTDSTISSSSGVPLSPNATSATTVLHHPNDGVTNFDDDKNVEQPTEQDKRDTGVENIDDDYDKNESVSNIITDE